MLKARRFSGSLPGSVRSVQLKTRLLELAARGGPELCGSGL